MRDEPGFHYDDRDVAWREFITDGCYYKLLHVDADRGLADMLVKFDPGCECLRHRHAAKTTSLVLEGELVVREQTAAGETIKRKPAGTYSCGAEGEVHIEGGGPEGAVIFFSMLTDGEVIYELLNPDLSLRRAITVADFQRDWREKWPAEAA